jgi:UDP-3-O-[3-hydroxymyristoyl] glucosamine N-acyltransferase
MYKISEFNFLKKEISFSYKKDVEFYCVAASEDKYNKKMLFYLLDLKYLSNLEQHKNNISAIICSKNIASEISKKYDVIISEEPKTLFFLIHNNLKQNESFDTIVEENCKISPLAYISPKNVIIKSGTIIEEFVSIKENVEIGNNCFIGAGSKIGTEGFNVFKLHKKNVLVKHHGKVIIGNNVTILSNCCIAKSIYSHINTIIKNNVMIDNLVHVAHDCLINENVEMASGTTLCGFTEIGEDTFMGVNSSVKQIHKIGKNNKVGMGAFVNFNTNDNSVIAGPEPLALEEARLYKHYKNQIIENLKK